MRKGQKGKRERGNIKGERKRKDIEKEEGEMNNLIYFPLCLQ